ncbi:MAG: low temperature requirement protein A [Mycobacteriaceae bacterium]
MRGRDPHENNRTATSLELLFDLVFVVAFGVAGSQFAHLIAEGHYYSGILGFSFSMFAVCWAWINFSWFASAYDTDDWLHRLATMVQMVGVLILTLGLPEVFHSIDEGVHVRNEVMVAGYVVMRVAMVFQWLRAAKQDPERRRTCLTYAIAITIAQCGWVGVIFVPATVTTTLWLAAVLIILEFAGPYIAENRMGGTPWHPHHIAERYGLLAIIALGEGVVGTVQSLSAVVEIDGWSADSILVGIAGIGLTFGMWWVYFLVPTGEVLHEHRYRAFIFGYLHIAVFAAIAATGAGLHVAAYFISHESHLNEVQTVLTVAIPIALYMTSVFILYGLLVQHWDFFHLLMMGLVLVVLACAAYLAAIGLGMPACLIVAMCAPFVTVISFEIFGHRYAATGMERMRSTGASAS